MKKLLLLICACVTTFFAVAQKEESVDPKAKALLDKALGVMENKKGMEIQFTIKVDNVRDSKSESFKGSAILKGEKFKMSLKDVDTYFDGKTQAVHMVKEKEVTITTPDKEDLKDINPLLLMKSYKTDYKMRYMGTSTVNGKVCEEENIALRGKGGIHTYFNVTKIIQKEFKDADFVFDAKQHPGVEVVNLQ